MNNNNGAPSFSMIEPSNPYANQAWRSQQQQQQPKKSPKWILFAVIGVAIVILIVAAIILSLSSSSTTADEEQPPEGEELITADDSYKSIVSGIYADLLSTAKNPTFEPTYESATSRFSIPPESFSCDELVEVKEMNPMLLSLHLDYGFVVAITGTGSIPFESTKSTILVYGGNLTESSYKTANLTCNSGKPSYSNHSVYDGNQIFDNLVSDKSYSIWIPQEDLSSEE